MKLAIGIIAIIVVLAFLANTTIQFKPFKITFETPLLAIGMLFIFIGIVFIQIQPHTDAYARGLKDGSKSAHEAAIEAAKQIIIESKKQQ
jgi:uncharacterized membrane protein YhdT